MGAFWSIFFRELARFCTKNWWIFIIFAISIAVIPYYSPDGVYEIIGVVFFHFLADIFAMMMLYEYAHGSQKIGSICQLISASVFLGISIHTLHHA